MFIVCGEGPEAVKAGGNACVTTGRGCCGAVLSRRLGVPDTGSLARWRRGRGRFKGFICGVFLLYAKTMSDKPASMYRDIDKPAYTRREYITGIPGSKIAQHKMGNKDADSDDYPVQISLVVEETVQIRHGSLEAARLSANRHLIKELGEGNYKMILRKFPHQVLRENKQATGAGADRVSDGMRQSFGKIVGTAARIHAGEQLFTAWCDVDQAAAVKEAFRRAYNKITPPCRIKVERGEELLIA
jgi:large subunit ribosomal protein L10e